MDPLLRELIEEGNSEEELEVILKLRPDAPPPPDARIITRFGDIATARVRRGRVRRLDRFKDSTDGGFASGE